MKIAIVGYDIEGRVSYDYFAAQNDGESEHELTICDQNQAIEVPDGALSVLGDSYLDNLDRFDLIVRTAGLPADKILAANPGVASKITSQINEFFKASPTRNIIGVTGTKGKGTTSTLLTRILEASGLTVRLGGNIGVPPLSFIGELDAKSWVVLELSSFQLSDLHYSPHIGVCLMVVPEHLNWHADMDDYIAAKSHLFAQQASEDIAIYFADSPTSQQIANNGQGRKLPFFAEPGATVSAGEVRIADQTICTTDELQLLGEHNWQNVCAAITAAWQVTQDVAVIRRVVTSFTGLPHRLELVRELDGVRYYNDSFAAGLHATEAALQAIPGKKVAIVGGFDRMLELDHFGEFMATHGSDIRQLVLIGASAARLADVLTAAGFTNFTVSDAKTMPDIIKAAQAWAQAGDAIVLSPGFASFDMFKNFEDRGNQFKQVVEQL